MFAKLSKAYDQVTALKELTLKLEPNAITCLLGHNGEKNVMNFALKTRNSVTKTRNCVSKTRSFAFKTVNLSGAGKSTLIHTLTGLVNATFGDA